MMNNELMAAEDAAKAQEREQAAISDKLEMATAVATGTEDTASLRSVALTETAPDSNLAQDNIESKVLKYVKLVSPEDKYLLDFKSIYETGNLYISNYRSEEYAEYKNIFRVFMGKYYNPKKFRITCNQSRLAAYRRNKDGTFEDKPTEEIRKLQFLNAEIILADSYKALGQQRNRLASEYKHIMSKPFVEFAVKSKFIKSREYLIKLLNEYYTVQYYYNKINNIIVANKEITLSRASEYFSQAQNELIPRLAIATVNLDTDSISTLNEAAAAKLDLYNKIRSLNATKDAQTPTGKKELKALITEYLNFDKNNNQELQAKIKRKLNRKVIKEVVILEGQELPEFANRQKNSQSHAIKKFYFTK
jgi:hypothetical protein